MYSLLSDRLQWVSHLGSRHGTTKNAHVLVMTFQVFDFRVGYRRQKMLLWMPRSIPKNFSSYSGGSKTVQKYRQLPIIRANKEYLSFLISVSASMVILRVFRDHDILLFGIYHEVIQQIDTKVGVAGLKRKSKIPSTAETKHENYLKIQWITLIKRIN